MARGCLPVGGLSGVGEAEESSRPVPIQEGEEDKGLVREGARDSQLLQLHTRKYGHC